jgi:hypothetical protein
MEAGAVTIVSKEGFRWKSFGYGWYVDDATISDIRHGGYVQRPLFLPCFKLDPDEI